MHIPQKSIQHLHFIGVGGIGMSGIAEVLHNLGYKIKGSDLSASYNTERLKNLGIEVSIGHHAKNVENAQVVIVSSAVSNGNPEVIAAREFGIPIIQRAEMLAKIMKLKRSIAISGTHGKTTTTSLMAALLDTAKLDPTVINGGIINAYNTNARLGTGEWSVVEADESDGSFTKLPATIAIVTNIEPEHMDFYKTPENLKNSFVSFVHNIPFYGMAVMCIDHPTVREIIPSIQGNRRIITYGFSDDAMIQAHQVHFDMTGLRFNVSIKDNIPAHLMANSVLPNQLNDLFLPMVGQHNALNALTTIAVAMELGIDESTLRQALSSFRGVKRRFTQTGEVNQIRIFDDYAHHPTEIQAVVLAARQAYPSSQVITVVQPHRFSRLHDLFGEFAKVLVNTDTLILAPVFSAGEDPIPAATSTNLAQSIREIGHKNVYEISEPYQIAPLIYSFARPGDVVVFMGAGNITQWAYQLPNQLSELYNSKENNVIHIIGKK